MYISSSVQANNPVMTWLVIGVVVAIGAVFAAAMFAASAAHESRRTAKDLAEIRSKRSGNRNDPETVLGIIKGTPRLFFYLDDSEVSSLYSQMSEAENVPSKRELEQQTGGSVSAGISGRIASARGERNRTSKIHESFEPESDPYRMYIAVERRLLLVRELTAVDLLRGFDRAPLAELDNLISRLESSGFTVSSDAVAEIRTGLSDQLEEMNARHIKKTTGYAGIRADYHARSVPGGGLMLEALVGLTRTTAVNVYCDDKWLRGSGRTAITPDADIRATCVGKIIRWDESEQQLVMLPIAVF